MAEQEHASEETVKGNCEKSVGVVVGAEVGAEVCETTIKQIEVD